VRGCAGICALITTTIRGRQTGPGGPAGLNAALILGRVGRPVLLADDGQPRNAASAAVHGFLSRDGADPAEIRRTARAELARYPSIQARDTTVQAAAATEGGFEVTLADGTTAHPTAPPHSRGGCCWPPGSPTNSPPSMASPTCGGAGSTTAPIATAGKPASRRWRCLAATIRPLTWR
jgi:hypothetical protein